jgi:hypothetical protein
MCLCLPTSIIKEKSQNREKNLEILTSKCHGEYWVKTGSDDDRTTWIRLLPVVREV